MSGRTVRACVAAALFALAPRCRRGVPALVAAAGGRERRRRVPRARPQRGRRERASRWTARPPRSTARRCSPCCSAGGSGSRAAPRCGRRRTSRRSCTRSGSARRSCSFSRSTPRSSGRGAARRSSRSTRFSCRGWSSCCRSPRCCCSRRSPRWPARACCGGPPRRAPRCAGAASGALRARQGRLLVRPRCCCWRPGCCPPRLGWSWRRREAAALLVCALAVVAPWTARNWARVPSRSSRSTTRASACSRGGSSTPKSRASPRAPRCWRRSGPQTRPRRRRPRPSGAMSPPTRAISWLDPDAAQRAALSWRSRATGGSCVGGRPPHVRDGEYWLLFGFCYAPLYLALLWRTWRLARGEATAASAFVVLLLWGFGAAVRAGLGRPPVQPADVRAARRDGAAARAGGGRRRVRRVTAGRARAPGSGRRAAGALSVRPRG